MSAHDQRKRIILRTSTKLYRPRCRVPIKMKPLIAACSWRTVVRELREGDEERNNCGNCGSYSSGRQGGHMRPTCFARVPPRLCPMRRIGTAALYSKRGRLSVFPSAGGGTGSYLRSSVIDQILQENIRNILGCSPVVVSKHSSFGVNLWQRVPKPRVAGVL